MLKQLNTILTFLLITLVSLTLANATVNVIDVVIQEDIYQEIQYNPLSPQSGLWVGAGEVQTAYDLTGTIIISNTHPTDSVQNVVVNVTQLGNIYNLSYGSGVIGFVTELNSGSDYALLFVGDLGPGQNTTFTYEINGTNIESPLDIRPTYKANVFTGSNLSVQTLVKNNINSSVYSENCIYDINIVENALEINSPLFGFLNFTFTNLLGIDSTNASIDVTNRTLTWDVLSNGCINSGGNTSIDYEVVIPVNTEISANYFFSNSTIDYKLNTSISKLNVSSIAAITDIELDFQKFQTAILIGDNATWQITSNAFSTSNITINLTEVSLWVSTRNGTGNGFTNPAIRDNDTISGADLLRTYNPNMLLNSTTNSWNNAGSEWLFNYTFSSSPIVWMDLTNNIVSDGIQLTDRQVTYGANEIYIKEVYVATGYWLEIKKNITRINDSEYNVLITVSNLGTSPTPKDQVVVAYNFIPNVFNLTSAMVYSTSTWYSTQTSNTTLNDPTYNGTMFQYGLLSLTNPFNSSLAAYGGSPNANNTWTVTYNISGDGQFNFDDLFLTGVDPLQVNEVGATAGLSVESVYRVVSSNTEYILSGLAVLIAALVFLF
jgi:hypothetical protein